jgi:hypothetical protein
VGPRAGLDAVAKRKIPCPSPESKPGRPARSLAIILTEIHCNLNLCSKHISLRVFARQQRGVM